MESPSIWSIVTIIIVGVEIQGGSIASEPGAQPCPETSWDWEGEILLLLAPSGLSLHWSTTSRFSRRSTGILRWIILNREEVVIGKRLVSRHRRQRSGGFGWCVTLASACRSVTSPYTSVVILQQIVKGSAAILSTHGILLSGSPSPDRTVTVQYLFPPSHPQNTPLFSSVSPSHTPQHLRFLFFPYSTNFSTTLFDSFPFVTHLSTRFLVSWALDFAYSPNYYHHVCFHVFPPPATTSRSPRRSHALK